ncbi:MAG: HPr family phosphocarrier protein [Christensenellales bacterium]
MKSVLVKLDSTDSVKELVAIVEKFPYEVDLRCGRHVVNAKSVLGILSFDLSDPLVLEIYSDECTELINELSRFIA